MSFPQKTEIVIGLPIYNNSTFLIKALESLRQQTHPLFSVVMLDDCSEDDSPQIAMQYADMDNRFHYYRNDSRQGLASSWRMVFELSKAKFRNMKFFAWASDHDLWDKYWIEKLLPIINKKDCVLAYPLAQRIDESDHCIPHDIRKGIYSTNDSKNVVKRFKSITDLKSNFGNMVYGLFRASALSQAGIFRNTLLPDRLLIHEIVLLGNILQIEDVLWYRRFRKKITLNSQANSLWPHVKPWYGRLPWEWVHSFFLVKHQSAFLKTSYPQSWHIHIILTQLAFAMKNFIHRTLKRMSKRIKASLFF